MEYNSPEFRKWLDKLQQESWQLELIISAFAIYSLFTAIAPVGLKSHLAQINGNNTFGLIWTIVSMALYILLFNLVLHVLLRGLWIGAIGLRYVSGDIDYGKLNYSQKFTSFLKRKVGSFDRYIAHLENYCSVLFAITFLLIFYVIGAFLSLFVVGLFLDTMAEMVEGSNKFFKFLMLLILIFTLLSTLTVFIDFIGQGFLKRKKWTSRIYFPIYRVFGFLTLSFLYRPLIYNFLDNKFGKRLSILLVPIYTIIIIFSSVDYQNSNYIGIHEDSGEFQIMNKHYENLSLEEDSFIDVASIPSKVIEKPYLKVFMLYDKDVEDFIYEKNESLKPKEDNRGFKSSITVQFNKGLDAARGKKDSTDVISYLKTTNQLYRIQVDSVLYNSDFIVSMNAKERLGFESYLNIKNLSEGKHILTITGPAKEIPTDPESKTIEKTLVTIPFWYFPQNVSSLANLSEIKIDSTSKK